MIRAIYDVVEKEQRTFLIDSIVFHSHVDDCVSLREYPVEQGNGYTGHVVDATFAVNNSRGSLPLQLWARTEAQISEAVGRLEEISGIKLKKVQI